MPSFAFARITLLFLAITFTLPGCAFLDQFKASLKQSSSQASSTDALEGKEQDALLVEALHFAKQIEQMPQKERDETAAALRQLAEEDISPRDRLDTAFLAFYVEEPILPPEVALSLLDYFDAPGFNPNQQIDGLVASLRQALAKLLETKDMLAEAQKELAAEHRKVMDVTDEMEAEKEKTDEMAQKLQKLLEIEKIMEQRK